MKLGKEYDITITRGSGPGGQHKNKVETCVTITHKLTGLSEMCQDTRSKNRNIKIAYDRLQDKIEEKRRSEANAKKNQVRRDQINSGDRSFRRRTYDFKNKIVFDHITGKKAPLQRVLDGDIDLLK